MRAALSRRDWFGRQRPGSIQSVSRRGLRRIAYEQALCRGPRSRGHRCRARSCSLRLRSGTAEGRALRRFHHPWGLCCRLRKWRRLPCQYRQTARVVGERLVGNGTLRCALKSAHLPQNKAVAADWASEPRFSGHFRMEWVLLRQEQANGSECGTDWDVGRKKEFGATGKGSEPSSHGAVTSGEQRDSALKIAIVDESPVRSAILEEGLREAGFTQVERIAETQNLLSRIYALDPDVILIDLENPSRDVLEQMFQMSRAVKRPVAMFVDQSDSASIQAAVDAGVSAYIVDGLRKERITNILDLCISRFNAFARLQSELDHAKGALEERKVIDRAKGVLMQARKLTEEKAYALLRTKAMNENKKIVEIAQSVLTAAELLK